MSDFIASVWRYLTAWLVFALVDDLLDLLLPDGAGCVCLSIGEAMCTEVYGKYS